MPSANRCIWTCVLALIFISAPALAAKKPGIKGRYLELDSGVILAQYSGAVIVLDSTKITSDKDKPVDTEAVRTMSDEMLRDELLSLGLFKDVLSSVPAELPEDTPVIRMTTALTLQHGSQAMRFFVAAGAGKSKLHIRIDISDVKSGKRLGFFNGYGTGAGFWSMSGGGVQRMARDDFEENYKELARLLAEQMK